ncbi:uncharacterized protein [Montipora foliosa]|uniref:uncharacterized protein isoform X1 n=1 Tax=Montipora foliosa TaxID=591990 RepID=UPI0035F1BD78
MHRFYKLLFLGYALVCLKKSAFVECKCSRDSGPKICQQGSQICPACIEVSWVIRPPFAYLRENSTAGILLDVLILMLGKCCGNEIPACWNISHYPPEKHAERLLSTARDSHVIYPIIVDKQEAADMERNLISLMPSTSIAFVVPRGQRESYPKKLLMSVFEAWPVLILAILLSLLAGAFLWFLDTWYNEQEFPRTFFRGSWEGFWWAFVSMTTVGYGDRAPRSVLGRMFAVIWILNGICICSIFTATLTTSLTTISLDTKKSLPGSKVGVLERSIEMTLAMRQQADLRVYDSAEEMKLALDRGDIEGVLLDNYQINYYTKTLFPGSDFKTDEVHSEEELSYGAMVNDTSLAKCFKTLIAEDKYMLYDFIRKELKNTLKEGGGDEAVQNSQSIFDPTGDLFFPSLYFCIGLVAFIVVVGIAAEFLYFRPGLCKRREKEGNSTENIPMTEKGEDKTLEQLEQEMLKELQALFTKYRGNLENFKNNANNGLHPTV